MSKLEEETKAKNIQYLREKLVTADVNDLFKNDMRKWEETLKDRQQDPAKINALKKTLLLYGASNMMITGPTVGKAGMETRSISAAENKMPISHYFSGHMGRVYMSLPPGTGQKTLDWIAGNNKIADGGKVIKPRFAATHAGEVGNDGKVVEKKLSAFNAFITGLTSRTHYGMDVAMGGKGNRFLAAPNTKINDDGSSGHIYYNLNKGRYGDSLGCGLEGTAPGKSSPLGSHSLVGAADEFGALEGAKYAVTFSPKSSQCKNSIMTYLDKTLGLDITAASKIRKYYEYQDKPWYLKIFSSGNLSTKEFAEECKKVKIEFTGNDKYMLTEFGKKCAQSGMVVRDMYNGASVNLSNKNDLLDSILGVEANEIPNEIIYYKPQKSPESFLAQSAIYHDMENRPILRDNPQFSHETSVAIGLMYNALQDFNISDERKVSIRNTLDLLNKENLQKYNININTFEIAKDIPTLIQAQKSTLDTNVINNLSIMQEVALKANSSALITKLDYQKMQNQFTEAIKSPPLITQEWQTKVSQQKGQTVQSK